MFESLHPRKILTPVYTVGLVAVVLTSVFAACGKDNNVEGGSRVRQSESLTVYHVYRMLRSSHGRGDDVFLEMLERETGIKLEPVQFNTWWIDIDQDEPFEVISNIDTLINDYQRIYEPNPFVGGEKPDLVLERRDEHLEQMIDAGVYRPFDELLQSLPNLRRSHGDVFWEANTVGATLPGYPLYSCSTDEVVPYWIIRRDALEAVGADSASFDALLRIGENSVAQKSIATCGVALGTIGLIMSHGVYPISIDARDRLWINRPSGMGSPARVQVDLGIRFVQNPVTLTPLYYDIGTRRIVDLINEPPPKLIDLIYRIARIAQRGVVQTDIRPEFAVGKLMSGSVKAVFLRYDADYEFLDILMRSTPDFRDEYEILPLDAARSPMRRLRAGYFLCVYRETEKDVGIRRLLSALNDEKLWERLRYGIPAEDWIPHDSSRISWPEDTTEPWLSELSLYEILTRGSTYERVPAIVDTDYVPVFRTDDLRADTFVQNPFTRSPSGGGDGKSAEPRVEHAFEAWDAVKKRLYHDAMTGKSDFAASIEQLNREIGPIINAAATELEQFLRRGKTP